MIPLGPWIRRLASVTVGTLLLAGCATSRVSVPSSVAGAQIAVRPGRAGFVVAAPHGTSDVNTADMAAEIARRTGFGLVVATGFGLDDDEAASPARHYQGNRPLAGGPGRPPDEQEPTNAARIVYDAYEQSVLEAAQGALRFYAEIHGNNRAQCAGQIEIATVGIDVELARRLRTLAELIRDAHLRAHDDVPRLAVLVEPADDVTYRASAAKREGILRRPERALHIELPRCARRDWREIYTAILAEFLDQAVTLPIGR
jgi:hypothetical protein